MHLEKEVLEVLCKCIKLLIGVKIEPENFTSAYDDRMDSTVRSKLESILSILSRYAVRAKGYNEYTDFDFRENLAILRYPVLELYVPPTDGGNRALLIALAWLLGTENVLTVIHRIKLTKRTTRRSLDNENLTVEDIFQKNLNGPLPISDQLDKILHLSGKVNLNFRQIWELKREWCRLALKVGEAGKRHLERQPAASLPDLRVSEVALTKRIVMRNERESVEDHRKLQEFKDAHELLVLHSKWLDTRHIFFDWMTTAIEERRKIVRPMGSKILQSDLERFTSRLRYLIEENCKYVTEPEKMFQQTITFNPPSRLKNTQSHDEAHKCLNEINKHTIADEKSMQNRKNKLAAELKAMLEQIPLAYRVT